MRRRVFNFIIDGSSYLVEFTKEQEHEPWLVIITKSDSIIACGDADASSMRFARKILREVIEERYKQ